MTEDKPMQGVFVPDVVASCKALTPLERLLLSQILFWDHSEDGCWASNETLAAMLGTTPNRVSKLVADLKRRELVFIRYARSRRYIHVNYGHPDVPLEPFSPKRRARLAFLRGTAAEG